MRRLAIYSFIILAILCFLPLTENRFFSCAICGMKHDEYRLIGFVVRASERDTRCGKWYRANVEPSHGHVWVSAPGAEHCNIFAVSLGTSLQSGRAGGPIVRWNPKVRMLMYQRCPDPILLRTAFLQLSNWETHKTQERAVQVDIELKLAAWVDSGLVEPWPLDVE